MENPLTVARFGVEIDGKVSDGKFTAVKGILHGNEVIETRVTGGGGQPLSVIKQPGSSYWSPVELTVAVTSDISANDWIKETMDGGIDSARVDWSIVAYDQTETEVARWNMERAWISEIRYSTLDAGANDIQYETWTVVHEGIYREA